MDAVTSGCTSAAASLTHTSACSVNAFSEGVSLGVCEAWCDRSIAFWEGVEYPGRHRVSSGMSILLAWSVGTSAPSGKAIGVAANVPMAPVKVIPTQNGASLRSRRFAIALLIKTSHHINPIFERIGSLILLGSIYIQTLGDNQWSLGMSPKSLPLISDRNYSLDLSRL